LEQTLTMMNMFNCEAVGVMVGIVVIAVCKCVNGVNDSEHIMAMACLRKLVLTAVHVQNLWLGF
jgi:hypothetical protein